MRNKQKKKPGAQLQRMLLDPVPETPVPQPYFSIPSPSPYRFPLSETMLQGVKLLQHYQPDDTNQKIRSKLPNQRIERMSRYKNSFCMMGKNGNGLIIDDRFLDIRGATAFAYGPTHLIIAFQDLRLQVYSLQLKLIKILKKFSLKKITFLKILSVPKAFQSIIILGCQGKKLYVHRIQKSLFSTLSTKLTKEIISSLEYPVTQITQIPAIFKYHLRKDHQYRDCSLVCISAVNRLYILKINHFRISMDDFISIDHIKNYPDVTINTVSWGQANIEAPSRFITGSKLVLTYSFGNQLYFLALREIEKYIGGEIVIKYEWAESCPLRVDEGNVAFCQYMKKNQILIITDDNTVIIFHTRKFDIFEKQFRTKNIEKFVEKFSGNLEATMIGTVPLKKHPESSMETRDQDGLTAQERQMMSMTPLVTYADTFQYEYPSNEIFFLTEKKFGIYLYCDWKIIANIMKVQQKYECAMLFLIAIYKKVNRFDLGVEDSSPQELSEVVHMLTIEYINNRLSKIKNMPQILKNIFEKQQYFKMVVTPIQFLTETQQFTFLFDIAKDKIISSLLTDSSDSCFQYAQKIFYAALIKFIEHGRIKFIPEDQLKVTLTYFTNNDSLQMIDKLAIYFDLSKIDRNILIQCLLNNNLVVSLAHVCTQGNESQFVTPFVKFWGISENYRRLKNEQYAAMFAIRALWYVQLCLQRNWALKEYSFEKYADMIRILSQHFLTESIITGLLQIKTEYCLQTLGFYFTIQNAQIICDTQKIELKLPGIKPSQWILQRQGYQQLELLLSAIFYYLQSAIRSQQQSRKLFDLFLSSIIIYKTVKFKQQKYLQILLTLIQNYKIIQSMNYGLQQKIITQFKEQYEEYDDDDIDLILASRYINKILTLVYYQCHYFIQPNLPLLFSKATQFRLTDLQAEISFLQGNFKRCIDIYKTAKRPSNSLIFEFLENSFKRLILEKRKDDKKRLATSITKQIKWMVQLNPHRTIIIIQNFIQQIQDNLIQALNDDPILQLQFLESIINDENLVQMKQKLKDQSISRYVALMAVNKKQKLLDAFKNNPKFATQDALKICQKNHVYECMQYLYGRMGNITQSVKIAAMRIDEILQMREMVEDQQYEAAPYIKIKQILDNALEVCRNNNSEEIWESLLDSFISLYEKYASSPNFPESQLEVFFYINGQVMENLASNCPIEHTIDLLQNKYKNLNMGGKMSHAFTNILSNLSHSINILYIATNLIQMSLHRTLSSDYVSQLECYSTSPVCENCQYGLIKFDRSVHFRCGHAYHKQCIVTKQPLCVSCLVKQTDQFQYYLNTLNPQHPKIKKVADIFDKYDLKKMQISQILKIQQFQKAEKKQEVNSFKAADIQKKNKKLQGFDEKINSMEIGNRRVLNGLNI